MKRIIIGALIGASTVPVIMLVGKAVSFLFNIDFAEAMMYATGGGTSAFMGAFLAKMKP